MWFCYFDFIILILLLGLLTWGYPPPMFKIKRLITDTGLQHVALTVLQSILCNRLMNLGISKQQHFY